MGQSRTHRATRCCLCELLLAELTAIGMTQRKKRAQNTISYFIHADTGSLLLIPWLHIINGWQ